MRDEFTSSIKHNQRLFGAELSDAAIDQLADYYELLLRHNPFLHLVAPCSPEEFATRHILESLTMPEFLPKKAKFVDVGSGGGLPAVPCLIVRDDLQTVLIETKEKKAKFLKLAADQFGLSDRAVVINKQFEEADLTNSDFITCRALDKFPEKLSRMLKWAKGRKLLLFGGPAIAEKLDKLKVKYSKKLMPLSGQRYLFIQE